MYEKQIILHNVDRKTQYVSVGLGLGRLLLRPEVEGIVNRLGSNIKTTIGAGYIDIIPPLSKKRQREFGKEIVNLAVTLDPTPPKPEFEISPKPKN